MMEEVEAGELFNLVDGDDMAGEAKTFAIVVEEEGDGLGTAQSAEDDLEEAVGDGDGVGTEGGVRTVVEHGTGDYLDATIALGPLATATLELVP